MDDNLSLETPEQLEIHYNIARLGSRFIAALWDSFIIGMLLFLLLFGAALLIERVFRFNPEIGNWILGAAIFLSFLIFWGYYVIFELLWNGQTPGKRLTGIRTVRRNGASIGLTESAIRNLVRIIDFFPGAYGFGVICMFADLQSRRLGDFAAGTLVVHDKLAVSLDTLGRQVTTDTRWLEPAIPNLSALDESDVEAIRRFLQRRGTLQNETQLAARLAARVRSRLALEPSHDTAAVFASERVDGEPEPSQGRASIFARERADMELLRRVVAQWGQ